MSIRAIISDFDGVIADSEPVHLAAFQSVLAEMGLALTDEDYYRNYIGYDDRTCFSEVAVAHGRELTAFELQTICRIKTDRVLEMITTRLKSFKGVHHFFDQASSRWPLAICSGAAREEIERMLAQLGLMHFEVIVSAEDVAYCKPDPEGYRMAYDRVRLAVPGSPLKCEECLVIEDTTYGIKAGKSAGMRVVAVSNSAPVDQLGAADLVVASLAELDLDTLDALLPDDQ